MYYYSRYMTKQKKDLRLKGGIYKFEYWEQFPNYWDREIVEDTDDYDFEEPFSEEVRKAFMVLLEVAIIISDISDKDNKVETIRDVFRHFSRKKFMEAMNVLLEWKAEKEEK